MKQVVHIARDACGVARLTQGVEITSDIFEESANDVIGEQQQVCQRVAELADKKSKWVKVIRPLGAFCMTQ